MGQPARATSPAPDLPIGPSSLLTLDADGMFERVLEALAPDLKEQGKLDLSRCLIDGTFV